MKRGEMLRVSVPSGDAAVGGAVNITQYINILTKQSEQWTEIPCEKCG